MSNQPDLLLLLHDLARHLRLDTERRASRHGLTRAQWAILFWLDRQQGLSQKELAELLEVEPISVARLVDRLEERGLLERRPDPSDRRIWRLHLLAPAHPLIAAMLAERAAMFEHLTEGFDPEALATMAETLARMKGRVLARLRARDRQPAETEPA
ncbi:MarR family transcriptional regulator [Rhodovastum atsumiense]|uniref:MarR family transcriptional regulator n=1 Tax=Rhodovastum atsumiense TaxID=504468 RepID=A0A5M6IR59_9PROT|nr:MarR family transcriptional regulator [Rhodovastum atsumiense]KAA5610018.1 MarR family transcriptional regulator [Rhodovastum atsumiense]CAH2602997.1 MarR family transcriptional regulator [Rhodovastum atsumiense]